MNKEIPIEDCGICSEDFVTCERLFRGREKFDAKDGSREILRVPIEECQIYKSQEDIENENK